MATNHQYITYVDSMYNYRLHMIKTKASNIQIVNLTSSANPLGRKINQTNYYGINASFYKSQKCTDGQNYSFAKNIAYNNGVPQGPTADYLKVAGSVNEVGECMIYYQNSRVFYAGNVEDDENPKVPKTNNSWAQGGIGLFLGHTGWLQMFRNDHANDSAGHDFSTDSKPRSVLLANTNTQDIYLIAANGMYSVEGVRHAIMEYIGIADTNGGTSNPYWRAILLDGGASCQIRGDGVNVHSMNYTAVPQIVALKNKN